MKYLIFLVFCGSLALEANGVRVRVFLQDSEKDGLTEVTDTSARRANKVKTRFEKQVLIEDPEARLEAPKKEKNSEYEKSVIKILRAVKKVVTQGEPLLYPKTVGCGKGVALKCQYTPNKTENELFFGYQDKPPKIMMRVMDSIDKFVSNPILRTYVAMMDYSAQELAEREDNEEKPVPRATEFDIKKMKLEKLLMFVKRIVHRDPEDASQKFVCGIQMEKETSNCKYYEEGTQGTTSKSFVGFRFDAADVNKAIENIFTSREIMKVFIKIANDAASVFPALKPNRNPSSDNARFKNAAASPADQKSVE